jgi:hypothetical protein
MKLRIFLATFFTFVLCTGCVTIFDDDFETDIVGSSPSTSPAGNPPDDSLNLQGPANSIIVINSVPHSSKAVKLDRTSKMPQTILECVTGGGPHTSGSYFVTYKAYCVNVSTIPELTTTIKSSGGHRAFELILRGGNYQLSSGDGLETLSGGYTANVIHSVFIGVDMDARRFWLKINGTDEASEKPFLDAGFNDVHLLRFEYPPPILEALPGTYVIDEVKISK